MFEYLTTEVVVIGVEDVLKSCPLCRKVKSSDTAEQRSVG